jgi:F-type H+-transporting ATPase subunit b
VKYVKKILLPGSWLLTCLIMLHLSAFEVLAADNSGNWRPIFDLVMRWVNFLILAFVLIKFSRAPIKKFLDGKHQDIADEIGGLEAEKEEALSQIDTYKNQLENSRKRLSDLKKRIVALGKKNKQLIIEAAEQESKILLKSAQQKINNRIVEARQELKSEIIDAAVALATKLLPEKITEEDNRKFIDAFMSSASSK